MSRSRPRTANPPDTSTGVAGEGTSALDDPGQEADEGRSTPRVDAPTTELKRVPTAVRDRSAPPPRQFDTPPLPASPEVHTSDPDDRSPADARTAASPDEPDVGSPPSDEADVAGATEDSRSDPAVAVGPLVADLPFADGGAPLSWKGELFQGPPAPGASSTEASRSNAAPAEAEPASSVRFGEVSAALAAGRPEPTDRIGSVLEAAEERGLIWLPDRRTRGGFTIDHLVISPNGVWVVSSEPEPTGRVEKRDIGDWFTPEPRLYIGDDDHTHMIRRLDSADDSLGRALEGTILADVPRYKVLCFVDLPPGWLDRPFPFGEVWVTWSHHLVEPMLSTVEHQPEELADMAEIVAAVLEPGR